MLSGGYSSVYAAKQAVNSYLKGLEVKPKKAAKK
jgi:hypothetical protein